MMKNQPTNLGGRNHHTVSFIQITWHTPARNSNGNIRMFTNHQRQALFVSGPKFRRSFICHELKQGVPLYPIIVGLPSVGQTRNSFLPDAVTFESSGIRSPLGSKYHLHPCCALVEDELCTGYSRQNITTPTPHTYSALIARSRASSSHSQSLSLSSACHRVKV